MNLHSALRCIALFFCCSAAYADAPCGEAPCVVNDQPPSWIFRRSTYTHDPYTGARVAQYMRTPPVEPLDDERLFTSRYRRMRTNLRGTDGALDTYYEVQAWGNGRGGIDAEWERFHSAWKESALSGGFFNQAPANGPWNYSPGYGVGAPSYGFPAFSFGPQTGFGNGTGNGYGPQGNWQQGGQDQNQFGGNGHDNE